MTCKLELTLTETLNQLGMRHSPTSRGYQRHVIGPSGKKLFTGTAHDVWAWLRETLSANEKETVGLS